MVSQTTADPFLPQIMETIDRFLTGYAVRVYLFGSRAAGAPRPGSDYDIGIDPGQELPVGLLSRLREALEELPVPHAVDVVDLSQTAPEFARTVRKEGVLWRDTSNG